MNQAPKPSHSKEELVAIAADHLQGVLTELKGQKKILARDWHQLTPRERSAFSREVKELEDQKKALLAEIEVNSSL